MADKELRYGFGENWQSFVDNTLDDTRVKQAVDALARMLGTDNLSGRRFLDIGCGSGLSSLAACLLGAESVTAFDYDANSVAAAQTLRERHGIPPEKWSVEQGSILDSEYISNLGRADVVYSWGVLHHTGEMWRAIDNAAGLVEPGGLFAIGIYNRVEGRKGSDLWWKIKRTYNAAPAPAKKIMEWSYASLLVLQMMAGLRNPVKYIREYGDEIGRGMDFMHDVRDWLGGFPFECALPGELFNYVHGKHGFRLVYMNTRGKHFCNEYTFANEGGG